NADRPARHVVALQLLQERPFDLGLLGDDAEVYLLPFTVLTQASAETLRHGGGTIVASSTPWAKDLSMKFGNICSCGVDAVCKLVEQETVREKYARSSIQF